MSFKTAETTLSADVATSGTITFSYPSGTDAGKFRGGSGHTMWAAGLQSLLTAPGDFTVSFGASNITVTYLGSTTLPSGTRVSAQFDSLGGDRDAPSAYTGGVVDVAPTHAFIVNLGAPDTADADGVCASQAGTADTAMTINGALASGGVATFDVPRNVVGAWTTAAKLTITGTDQYGETVVETTGAAGTAHTGKKAFKTVTSVVPDTNITGATVGTGDVLGLPVFLPEKGLVLREMEDGTTATAGTVVAGVTTAATATTGDVRGTYDPNSAADGSKAFALVAALPDASDKGVSQFGG